MIFIDDLYENIFRKHANEFCELDIITGYASGTFLKRVLDEFKHLNINLFVGMYKEGISRANHKIYTELTRNTSINVFYQVSDKPTHMKIYRFKKDNAKLCFVGSSNFSENGFEYNNEILTIVNGLDEEIFKNQLKNSLLCTSENIEDYIKIYEDSSIIEGSLVNEVVATYNFKGGNKYNSVSKSMGLLLNKLYTRRNNSFYKKFSFSVVLPKESDVSWYHRGVNDNPPYIKQNNQIKFFEVFPNDTTFKIYAPDQIFECEIGGKYYSNLYFRNVNIREYFVEKTGLNPESLIEADTLEAFRINKWCIERINEIEYVLLFEE